MIAEFEKFDGSFIPNNDLFILNIGSLLANIKPFIANIGLLLANFAPFIDNISSLLGNIGLLLGINEAKTHENSAFCNVFALYFVIHEFKLIEVISL